LLQALVSTSLVFVSFVLKNIHDMTGKHGIQSSVKAGSRCLVLTGQPDMKKRRNSCCSE